VSRKLFSWFERILVLALTTLPGLVGQLWPRLKGSGTPFVDDLQATSYYRTISTNRYQN